MESCSRNQNVVGITSINNFKTLNKVNLALESKISTGHTKLKLKACQFFSNLERIFQQNLENKWQNS
jgi:hypothetical protein